MTADDFIDWAQAQVANPTQIKMRCPLCGRHKRVEREFFDPEDAVLVVCPCPSCTKSDEAWRAVRWYDANGREVDQDW